MKCKSCGRTIEANSLYCNWCGHYQLKKPKDKITVPKPIQLPSKNWRIQLRKEGISVVEPTPEKCTEVAMRERKLWKQLHEQGIPQEPVKVVTLGEVVDNYITAKKAVLAPSTINGYQTIRDNYLKFHWDDDVTKLDTQEIVNDELLFKRKPKTIANAWGLVSSALTYAGYSFTVPTLPRKVKKDKAWLDYKEIEVFLRTIRDSDCELGALLALHSLRRSELFGLRPKDYDKPNKMLHIRGALLYITGEGWVYSELNKNDTSRRDVPILIDRLSELLDNIDPKQEFIVPASGCKLYKQINSACRFADLPEVGLHGLRHSFASLAYHLEIKKLTTQQIGGWKNSKVLDEIYTHNADYDDDVETIREHFREQKSGS